MTPGPVRQRGHSRAESFGARAERYDRSRPSYPPALIDELMSAAPGPGSRAGTPAAALKALDVLDVGCGTGIASRLFLGRGCRVLGVDPDPRMAAVARRHGLRVEIARFEDWEPAGRSFDLLVSGQAWHWVDPAAAIPRAAAVLRPGGLLAVFWNTVTHPPQVRAALEAAYQAHAPELISNNIALGTFPPFAGQEPDPDRETLAASGLFGEPARLRHRWDRPYTPAQWLDELPTHSNHNDLTPARLGALVDAMGARLAPIGAFTVRYETAAIVARRR